MKKFLLMSMLFLLGTAAIAQSQHIMLKFVGQSTDSVPIRMDYVEVNNLSGDSTIWADSLIIAWPDTVLEMTLDTTMRDTTTSIQNYAAVDGFALTNAGSNPFNGQTEVNLQMAEGGKVTFRIFDLTGKQVAAYNNNLPSGIHRFQIRVAQTQAYVVTAQCGAKRASMKLVNAGYGQGNGISYIGTCEEHVFIPKVQIDSAYRFGDTLTFAGFVTFNDSVYASDTIYLLMDSLQDTVQTVVLTFPVQVVKVTTWIPEHITHHAASTGVTTYVNDTTAAAPFTEVGIVWANHPNATIEDNRIVVTDTLEDIVMDTLGDFPIDLETLEPNMPYFVRAYAISNLVGEIYGNEYAFIPLSELRDNQPCAVATLTDANGITYNTVRIGRQCWTRENLRTTRYNDTMEIKNVADTILSVGYSDAIPYCYYPDSSEAAAETYGLLYNYMAVSLEGERSIAEPSGIRGICPEGWHVPAIGEWEQLTNYLEGQRMYHAGDISTNIAKALSAQQNWLADTVYTYSIGNNLDANNATGFSALPAGAYSDSTGVYTRFWSCSGEQPSEINVIRLSYDLPIVASDMLAPDSVASVRCVRDEKENVDGYACPGMATVTDVDGNVYNTILIGNQCWMRENLRTTHYADNTSLIEGEEMSVSTPYYYMPVMEESELSLYGLLYNWPATVMGGAQGICPDGWHVPTVDEWMELHRYVASNDENLCGSSANSIGKALAISYGWLPSSSSCDTGDTTTVHNATNFCALPAGRYPNNTTGINATFWTSTESSELQAVTRYLTYITPNFSEGNLRKDHAASVRCIKD